MSLRDRTARVRSGCWWNRASWSRRSGACRGGVAGAGLPVRPPVRLSATPGRPRRRRAARPVRVRQVAYPAAVRQGEARGRRVRRREACGWRWRCARCGQAARGVCSVAQVCVWRGSVGIFTPSCGRSGLERGPAAGGCEIRAARGRAGTSSGDPAPRGAGRGVEGSSQARQDGHLARVVGALSRVAASRVRRARPASPRGRWIPVRRPCERAPRSGPCWCGGSGRRAPSPTVMQPRRDRRSTRASAALVTLEVGAMVPTLCEVREGPGRGATARSRRKPVGPLRTGPKGPVDTPGGQVAAVGYRRVAVAGISRLTRGRDVPSHSARSTARSGAAGEGAGEARGTQAGHRRVPGQGPHDRRVPRRGLRRRVLDRPHPRPAQQRRRHPGEDQGQAVGPPRGRRRQRLRAPTTSSRATRRPHHQAQGPAQGRRRALPRHR